MSYSDKVIDHYNHPRNVGSMDKKDADVGTGLVGAPECGDVMKAETKRIQQYIQPENGTTEIALMYLPSETLYMEVVRNRELGDWMNEQHVFPVSPNTLLMTLHTISLVHKWYEVASRFEKSRAELAKAQKSFDFFQNQFENVGKNLNKAKEA